MAPNNVHNDGVWDNNRRKGSSQGQEVRAGHLSHKVAGLRYSQGGETPYNVSHTPSIARAPRTPPAGPSARPDQVVRDKMVDSNATPIRESLRRKTRSVKLHDFMVDEIPRRLSPN